ncbi:hypothetical protein AMEX_G26345 [Astyanax mexicanus]|uniref:Uncharacterized protein n=1 Tax=Astyanax mexicanus TaxID=7994 RepID=A0A8T2KQA4_ASTMX|nr:hypothetical protein AMEX_G26345 [Astyanax mexicanus]
MNTRRCRGGGAKEPQRASSPERSVPQSPQQHKAASPTAQHSLEVTKVLLAAEKEKVKGLQETIKELQADKLFLQEQLSCKNKEQKGELEM